MRRAFLHLVLLSLAFCPAVACASGAGAGEAIYRDGVLASGQALSGARDGAGSVTGTMAACANCHRRSGLGEREGPFVIPAVAANRLFRAAEGTGRNAEGILASAAAFDRGPYSEATLARAIREGVRPDGRKLNYLMPRYALDEASMHTLIDYLKLLAPDKAPGVTADTLQLATIVTPDADPNERKGMLDVLRRYVAENNAERAIGAQIDASGKLTYSIERKWQLHVWELSGPAESWEAQLQQKLAAQPVFAVISGLGGKTWSPVHRFCERASLPCLLPNVDLPLAADADFYSIYFSQGVLLEAQLIAHALQQNPARRIIQVYRADDIGAAAAQELAAATDADSVMRPIGAKDPDKELAAALAHAGAEDVVVLWLRQADLASLPAASGRATRVFASGLMAGLEHAPLAPAWRKTTQLTYPFELPERRRARMNFPLGWLAARHIPIVAERVQSNTYLACVILGESLDHLGADMDRDYLVETLETMLAYWITNGYFSRLALAPGQRFASKGGYLVRFAQPQGAKLVASSAWITP